MSVRRVLVVAVLLAATTSLAPTTSALAEDCTDGVIVVVDATSFGRGVSQTCVPGSPDTGLEALLAAGHTYDFVPRYPGLVCTIDARPDPCNGAPVDAYWSYWHADQGGTWRYSNQGAGSHSPPPGTVEGWRFGSGSPPGIAPPDGSPEPEPEPEPDEEPEEESSPGSDGSGGSGGAGGSGGSGGSDDTGGSGSGSSASSGSSGSAPGSSGSASSDTSTSDPAPREGSDEPDEDPAPEDGIEPAEPADEVPVDGTAPDPSDRQDTAAADEDTAPREDDAADPTRDDTVALPDRGDAGMPIGLVAGGGLIAGLAGLTALQVRRRRLED